jgi:L-ascorbate metabolism protein UlaG (beta-lactamase superfamily)
MTARPAEPASPVLRLQFLGHAAFALTLGTTRLLLDPHKPGAVGGRFSLPAIQGPFDAIVYSHNHDDHCAWSVDFGTSVLISGPAQIADITVTSRAVFHDAVQGTRMGLSRMMSLQWQGLRVVHSGDIGSYDQDDIDWLRGTDVLLLSAGGTFTLGGQAAAELAQAVQPKVVVPMHCRDARVRLELEPVEHFVSAAGAPVLKLAQLTWPLPQLSTAPMAVVLLDPP